MLVIKYAINNKPFAQSLVLQILPDCSFDVSTLSIWSDNMWLYFLEEWENTLFPISYKRHGKWCRKRLTGPSFAGTGRELPSKFTTNLCSPQTYYPSTLSTLISLPSSAKYLSFHLSSTCITSTRKKLPTATPSFSINFSAKTIRTAIIIQRAASRHQAKTQWGGNQWGRLVNKAACTRMLGGENRIISRKLYWFFEIPNTHGGDPTILLCARPQHQYISRFDAYVDVDSGHDESLCRQQRMSIEKDQDKRNSIDMLDHNSRC